MYLLDTDHISFVQRTGSEPGGRVLAQCRLVGLDRVFTAIVSFHEQTMGWNAFLQQAESIERIIEGYRRFDATLAHFAGAKVLPFDSAAAVEFQALKKRNLRIGVMDLRIAAIALANHMVLVTRNDADFARVPGLKIEDWTRSK